jgi:hypothetical protein
MYIYICIIAGNAEINTLYNGLSSKLARSDKAKPLEPQSGKDGGKEEKMTRRKSFEKRTLELMKVFTYS